MSAGTTQHRRPARVRALVEWLLILAVVTGFALALRESALRDSAPEIEKEQRVAAPSALDWFDRTARVSTLEALRGFPAASEAWANDHFGFRSDLLRAFNYVKLVGLGVSPIDLVVAGRDGWLFYAGERSLENYRGIDVFSAAELEAWRAALEARTIALARRGIPYLFVVAPDKQTIYPEYLPPGFTKLRAQTRLDQLVAHLEARSFVRILDLREVLRREREEHLVYFPLGTHWTSFGAYATYAEVMRALAAQWPALAPIPRSEFEFPEIEGAQGDSWAERLHLEGLITQTYHDMRLRSGLHWKEVRRADQPPRDLTTEHPNRALPRAVVFHDSFTQSWMPWFSEHFSRVAYTWLRDPDFELVRSERPDVVISEVVERMLQFAPAIPDDELALACAGTYLHPSAGTLRVDARADARGLLRVDLGGRASELARSGSGREYRARETGSAPSSLRFEIAPDGRCDVVLASLAADGGRVPFARVDGIARFPADAERDAGVEAWTGTYRRSGGAIDLVATPARLFVFDPAGRLVEVFDHARESGFRARGGARARLALEGADSGQSLVWSERGDESVWTRAGSLVARSSAVAARRER